MGERRRYWQLLRRRVEVREYIKGMAGSVPFRAKKVTRRD
jgi:hypothetical protein